VTELGPLGPSIETDADNITILDFDLDGEPVVDAQVPIGPLDSPRPIRPRRSTPRSLLRELDSFPGPFRMRVGWLGSLAATMIGMILVAAPLWWMARDVEVPPTVLAPESMVVITTDTASTLLHGATVSKRALISFVDDDIQTVAFTLSNADRAIVSERVDTQGPEFDFLTDQAGRPLPLDTRKLPNGIYEMFITATDADEVAGYTTARFEVRNR